MINSFKNPAIMRILRTTERYEAGWREQNFIPDDEAPGLIDRTGIPMEGNSIGMPFCASHVRKRESAR